MPSIFGAIVNLGISTLSAEKGRTAWGRKQKAIKIIRSNVDFFFIFFILIGQTILNLHVHPLLSLMVNENHDQKVYLYSELFLKHAHFLQRTFQGPLPPLLKCREGWVGYKIRRFRGLAKMMQE